MVLSVFKRTSNNAKSRTTPHSPPRTAYGHTVFSQAKELTSGHNCAREKLGVAQPQKSCNKWLSHVAGLPANEPRRNVAACGNFGRMSGALGPIWLQRQSKACRFRNVHLMIFHRILPQNMSSISAMAVLRGVRLADCNRSSRRFARRRGGDAATPRSNAAPWSWQSLIFSGCTSHQAISFVMSTNPGLINP